VSGLQGRKCSGGRWELETSVAPLKIRLNGKWPIPDDITEASIVITY